MLMHIIYAGNASGVSEPKWIVIDERIDVLCLAELIVNTIATGFDQLTLERLPLECLFRLPSHCHRIIHMVHCALLCICISRLGLLKDMLTES